MKLDCSEVFTRLLAGNGEDVREHVRECSVCRERLGAPLGSSKAFLGEAARSEPEREGVNDVHALWQGMPEALAHEARWFNRARNLSTGRRYALLGVALLLPVVAVRVWGPRADLALLPIEVVGPFVFLILGLMAFSVRACLEPLHRRALGPELHTGLACMAALIGASFALLPEAHRAHAESLRGVDHELLHRAFGCFAWGSLLAAFGMVCAVGVLRGPRELGVIPGGVWAIGVSLATVGLVLHCPLVSQLHLMLGHASVGAAFVLLMLAARRWGRGLRARHDGIETR